VVKLELDGDAAPVTAGNFVDLVKRGVYDGTVFHRVIREPVPFVVQGGDPSSSDPSTLKSQYGQGSFIDPDSGQARFIPLELSYQNEDEPRYSRQSTNPSDLQQLKLSHERGALAMARSQSPDSASAQFYMALKPLPELDGRYAVFGRVTDGLDVVDAIEQDDKLLKAKLLTPGL
jgi:peptidyl-prolyl cis-trans isomerase B (cyclophilin B)